MISLGLHSLGELAISVEECSRSGYNTLTETVNTGLQPVQMYRFGER